MSVTLASVERINALKNGIEATTGETYADLTAGVQALKNGYGQGGSGGGTEELETLIDESGVLESTDGTVEEKVEQLIDKAEDENAWYNFISNSELYSGRALFQNFNGKKLPRVDFSKKISLDLFCHSATIEIVDYYINSENVTTAQQAFNNTANLRYMVGLNISKTQNVNYCLANSGLETIVEPLDFSSVMSAVNTFQNTNSLTDIRFVSETIKISITIPSAVLSAESIQSIIDGLATVETAQTLTLHADIKAKLTETQLTTITGKNWNLA